MLFISCRIFAIYWVEHHKKILYIMNKITPIAIFLKHITIWLDSNADFLYSRNILIVSNSHMIRFYLRHRKYIFPKTPLLILGTETRALDRYQFFLVFFRQIPSLALFPTYMVFKVGLRCQYTFLFFHPFWWNFPDWIARIN